MGASLTVPTIFSVDYRSQKRRFDLSEEIKKIMYEIRELSLYRENVEEKILNIEKELEETRTQCKQEESQNERLKILHKQLNLLLSEKVQLSHKLEYLRDRTEYTTGKLSSLRDRNLSDQKEDRSRVRGKIARMVTRKKSTTREIDLKQPDWRLLFT